MDYIWKNDIWDELWNSFMNCWWLYMFICIYVVGGYICLWAYMLHICCWWLYMFVCIYVVGGYIFLCAYMLLVSLYVFVHICCWWIALTCYWWWIVGVSMYWTMLVWISRIRMKYVLLLSSPKFTHSCCWISSPCWWRILMHSIMRGVYAGWVEVGFHLQGFICELTSFHDWWHDYYWGVCDIPLWCFMLRYFHACLLGDLFEDVMTISYLFIIFAWFIA